jgi:hypothetical protein
MLDALAILVSCGGCIFIAWRAMKLDREIPWFGQGSAAPERSRPGPIRPARARR